MSLISDLKKDLRELSDPRKKEVHQRFFKTGHGEYGEGDIFIGVTVPDMRRVAKKYRLLSHRDIAILLNDEIHECRFTALAVMAIQFEKGDKDARSEIVRLYCDNMAGINNWDLVDLSAPKILGPYFFDKDRSLLYELAHSGDLWKQRIAVMSTFYFIKKMDYADTLRMAEMMLAHGHDLIHKAVGWMLREIGNRDIKAEKNFLRNHYKKMPRTMLRYAIEKFPKDEREKYLKGRI